MTPTELIEALKTNEELRRGGFTVYRGDPLVVFPHEKRLDPKAIDTLCVSLGVMWQATRPKTLALGVWRAPALGPSHWR